MEHKEGGCPNCTGNMLVENKKEKPHFTIFCVSCTAKVKIERKDFQGKCYCRDEHQCMICARENAANFPKAEPHVGCEDETALYNEKAEKWICSGCDQPIRILESS